MKLRHHVTRIALATAIGVPLLNTAMPARADSRPRVKIWEYQRPPDSQPEGIVAGPDGKIWFTESYGNPPPPGAPAAIGKFNPSGSRARDYPVPTKASEPHGITVGADGNLWFTERTGNKIARITATGKVTEFNVPTTNSYPDIIVQGPDARLWFTELLGNKIASFDPAATGGQGFTELPIPTSNSEPHDLVVGPDGNLWFTEVSGNKIARMTTAGVFTEFPVPTPDSEPFGMTPGPDGNLWFTECGPGSCLPSVPSTTNNIGRLNPSTGEIAEFPLPNGGRPFGIATGFDGNLWFTEIQGNKIGVITTTGVVTAEYPVPTPDSYPLEIIRGPDSHLWFTEHGATANKVARIDIKP